MAHGELDWLFLEDHCPRILLSGFRAGTSLVNKNNIKILQVFTSFFALEAALKLMALSKEYFSSGWNIFDLIIVIASLIDLSVESADLPGISVLRGMRLVCNCSPKLVQSGWSGCRTGNREKLSNSQVCCLAQLCLAAA